MRHTSTQKVSFKQFIFINLLISSFILNSSPAYAGFIEFTDSTCDAYCEGNEKQLHQLFTSKNVCVDKDGKKLEADALKTCLDCSKKDFFAMGSNSANYCSAYKATSAGWGATLVGAGLYAVGAAACWTSCGGVKWAAGVCAGMALVLPVTDGFLKTQALSQIDKDYQTWAQKAQSGGFSTVTSLTSAVTGALPMIVGKESKAAKAVSKYADCVTAGLHTAMVVLKTVSNLGISKAKRNACDGAKDHFLQKGNDGTGNFFDRVTVNCGQNVAGKNKNSGSFSRMATGPMGSGNTPSMGDTAKEAPNGTFSQSSAAKAKASIPADFPRDPRLPSPEDMIDAFQAGVDPMSAISRAVGDNLSPEVKAMMEAFPVNSGNVNDLSILPKETSTSASVLAGAGSYSSGNSSASKSAVSAGEDEFKMPDLASLLGQKPAEEKPQDGVDQKKFRSIASVESNGSKWNDPGRAKRDLFQIISKTYLKVLESGRLHNLAPE